MSDEPKQWNRSGEVSMTMRSKWLDLAEGLEAAADYVRNNPHEAYVPVAVRAAPPRFSDDKFFRIEISYVGV